MHKTLDITDSSDGKTTEGRQTLWSLHRSFQPKCKSVKMHCNKLKQHGWTEL